MKNIATALAVLCLAGMTSGCTTVVKRAIKEARGAQSKIMEVPGTMSGDLARFNGVEIQAPRSDLGELVSAEFLEALPNALRQSLTEADGAPFPNGEPRLIILPQIQWYDDASGLGELAGSYSYAVVLFYLGGENAEYGKLQVVTKDASSHVGDEGMAESMAEELAAWFAPPPDEDEAEE